MLWLIVLWEKLLMMEARLVGCFQRWESVINGEIQSAEVLIGPRWVSLEIWEKKIWLFEFPFISMPMKYQLPVCFSYQHFLFGVIVCVGKSKVFCFVCKDSEVQCTYPPLHPPTLHPQRALIIGSQRHSLSEEQSLIPEWRDTHERKQEGEGGEDFPSH